ncbi:hypothetical protein [Actinomadura sp. WMMA1423]|nr:hypothetical protein [Actinomadura sp. WMMA1423]
MTGLRLAPTLAWASLAAGLATGHAAAGVLVAAVFALVGAAARKRRR